MAGTLDGVRILDLSRLLPGPYCTMVLADLGAEVVKVEDPVQGDYIRWIPPYLGKASARYLVLNRNKKSITLNLKDPEGAEIFFKLLPKFDVVVDSFRPGVLEKMGVGYEKAAQVNPRIIYCALTGYGQDGPYSRRAGHDINYIGYSGVLSLTAPKDGKPVPPGTQLGDLGGALNGVIGILAALLERAASGRGQFVDVSLADSAFSTIPMIFGNIEAGEPPARPGKSRLNGGVACYNTYRTSDGEYVCLGAIEPKFFSRFCSLVGREDLEVLHLDSGKGQLKLEQELTDLFLTKTKREWCELLEEEDVCFGPVNFPEQAMEDPQMTARKMLIDVPVGEGRTMRQTALPFKLSRTPPGAPKRPPEIGEHTAEILGGIGLAAQDLELLRKRKVIR